MTTAASTGFPLPLRNALAGLAIASLDDAVARDALAWLAADPTTPAPAAFRATLERRHLVDADGTLLTVHRPHATRAAAHAARALRAAAAFRPAADADAIGIACAKAVALWNERLFFEVHEVLESEWMRAAGALRQALQGLIQVGVALHHHAHGNARGARTLMHEGRARLAANAAALPAVDVHAILDATASWETALIAGTATVDAAPPPLALR